MLKTFQHDSDIVKVSDFDYGLWPGSGREFLSPAYVEFLKSKYYI